MTAPRPCLIPAPKADIESDTGHTWSQTFGPGGFSRRTNSSPRCSSTLLSPLSATGYLKLSRCGFALRTSGGRSPSGNTSAPGRGSPPGRSSSNGGLPSEPSVRGVARSLTPSLAAAVTTSARGGLSRSAYQASMASSTPSVWWRRYARGSVPEVSSAAPALLLVRDEPLGVHGFGAARTPGELAPRARRRTTLPANQHQRPAHRAGAG